MDKTELPKHVVKWACGLMAALLLYAALRGTQLHEAMLRETEGLNTLILLIGSIYAVMFAFVIFVIWGQFAEVGRMGARECSAIQDLLRFSRFVGEDARHSIRRAVTEYTRLVFVSEWPALGNGLKDDETERSFNKLLKTVVETGTSAPEEVMHKRLIDIARNVGEWRDERIEKSLTRIPATLRTLVRGMAAALALLVFTYPFHNGFIGACCFALVGTVLFSADVVMMDTDNPFSGLCNVNAKVFSDLAGVSS